MSPNRTLPSIVASAVVPTEYDVTDNGRTVTLSDDRLRSFTARTLNSALRKAERAQDPADPIHHEPFPDPTITPLPSSKKSVFTSRK